MKLSRPVSVGFMLTMAVLFASGCASTQPAYEDGATPRVSAESFYREAPWTQTRPTNIKAVGDSMVATTQGLADISSDYSRQLQLQNQAQMELLNNPVRYESRVAAITECVNAGGGTQGGMKCERMGFADFDKSYGIDAMNETSTIQTLSDEIVDYEFVQGLGGWAGKNAHEYEYWKAGHEFGELMIQENRNLNDSIKRRTR